MVGWHHQLNRCEFEQAPGVGDGQGILSCCSPWDHKESDTTERLNWTDSVFRSPVDHVAWCCFKDWLKPKRGLTLSSPHWMAMSTFWGKARHSAAMAEKYLAWGFYFCDSPWPWHFCSLFLERSFSWMRGGLTAKIVTVVFLVFLDYPLPEIKLQTVELG